MEIQNESQIQTRDKNLIKGVIVGVIALLLLIPMSYIKSLVLERQDRQKKVTEEITGKSAQEQNIIGPILVLPYHISDSSGKRISTHKVYFLPEKQEIKSTITPRKKYRGIYKVMFFDSKTEITGSFGTLPLSRMGISATQVEWQKAKLVMSVADNRGLIEQPTIKWNNVSKELMTEKMENLDVISAPLDISNDAINASFSSTLNLNGSERLYFTPVGKTTNVTLSSSWKDPSFTGSILPHSSDIGKQGFKASWTSMSHARDLPQYWTDNEVLLSHQLPPPEKDVRSVTHSPTKSLSKAAFGVNLFIHVNGYQKTLRSIKYAILCILLTFATFFLIETAGKTTAHPFQYGLVGLALVLFYTLLLSFTEYIGFNLAYLVATAATTLLIGWFVKAVLRSSRLSTILCVVLVLVYTYVFTLMNLQDYSLLLGSLGLFAALAVVMNYSRKLSWA